MESARYHRRSSTRRLVLLTLLLALYTLAYAAVNVGEADSRLRLLDEDDDADSGSGSGSSGDDNVGCPNAVTLAAYDGLGSSNNAGNTTAQIVNSAFCNKPLIVSARQVQDKVTGESVYELDVRKQAIQRVTSIPSAVRILRLDNNSVESFQLGRGRVNTTTHIYLSNNSILSLDDFKFPSSLLTLDLTNNLIQSVENTSFPAKITMLNLTRNPIESLQYTTLPPKLQHLNVAGGSLSSLLNFSFPNSVTSLNFSANPITHIAGVIFPAALDRLVINAGYTSSSSPQTTSTTTVGAATSSTPLLFAKQVISLEEFEVRKSDADRFQKLSLFDVSATSNVKCSDPLAKHFYVNDTMLCVLSDDDFDAKYATVAAAAAIAEGAALVRKNSTQKAHELPLLVETWHQSRSWLLVVSVTLLTGFVVVIGALACIHASVRRVNGAYNNRKSEFAKSRALKTRTSGDKTGGGLEKSEKETESLLSNSQEEITSEMENVKSEDATDGDGVFSRSLSQKLEAFLISPSLLEFPARLPRSSLIEPERSTKHSSRSQFVYTLASLKNHVVVLKTLRLHSNSKNKTVEFESNRSAAFAWDRGRSTTLQGFSSEIQLHSMVSHANIVKFIGYIRSGSFDQAARRDGMASKKSLTLVTEYMNMGTLDSFIDSQKVLLQDALILQRTGVEHVNITDEDEEDVSEFHDDSLDLPEAPVQDLHVWNWHRDSPSSKSKLSVSIDIARALVYMHSFSPALFHGNFSSRKVLLDENWRVKLNDLSCSSALLRWSERHASDGDSSSNGSSSASGSSRAGGELEDVQMDMTVWTAPEVIDGQQYTTKADMYSFGILLSYLDTYEFPVDALHRVDSEVAILSSSSYNVIPMMGSRSPVALRMLAMQCISFQPEDRPSADEALNELLAIQTDLKELAE